MEKFISFLGSNARKLYVENIYQCLALPKEHVIQYRYQEKYIDNDFLENFEEYIGEKGVIFYYYRFDESAEYKGKDTNEKDPIVIPIREVIIKDIKKNEEIDHVNFYLELGDFISFHNTEGLNMKDSPLGKSIFVKQINNIEFKRIKWIEKIKEVKDYFQGIHFFHILSIVTESDKDKSKVKYHDTEYKSNLELNADSSYIFEFLTYDTSSGLSPLDIKTDEQYIKLNDELEKGTVVNSKKIKFLTRPIDYKNESTYITVSSEQSDFTVSIPVHLKKKWRSSIFFAISSSALVFSIPLINLFGNSKLEGNVIVFSFITAVIVFFATFYLHRNYNKK